jgi:hypothetical protein
MAGEGGPYRYRKRASVIENGSSVQWIERRVAVELYPDRGADIVSDFGGIGQSCDQEGWIKVQEIDSN